MAAERVALALYHSDEHGLAVAAACGYAMAAVKDLRIEPGEWVMGHVYASRRALVVRDVRRLRALSDATRRYRSYSFAAVPVMSEGQVLGVLSATDKFDAGTFTQHDVAALRAIGGVAALGLTAARSEAEVVRLAHAATIDSLTGLYNRRSFDTRVRQEIERAKRSSGTLAVLMIDIDDFKHVNDTQGHPAGDAVLRAVADVLRSVGTRLRFLRTIRRRRIRDRDAERRSREHIGRGGANQRTHLDQRGDGERRRCDDACRRDRRGDRGTG